MQSRKTSPTIGDRQDSDRNGIRKCVGQKELPDLYVGVSGGSMWETKYAKAHLRNKGGYLYLCWRDGMFVNSRYLGKSPKS